MNISKTTAKKLHEELPWFREELEQEFGADLFKKREFENIKSFDDACRVCGTTEKEFNEKWVTPLTYEPDTVSFERLKIINKAINGEWTPDYSNSDQQKWFPIFVLSSGFGFSGSGYDCDYSAAGVGSRLCFETQEQADWSGTQFIDIWKAFITNKY